jgi:hypothetical protein
MQSGVTHEIQEPFDPRDLQIVADSLGLSLAEVEALLPEYWNDPHRILSASLREKFFAVLEEHPARNNSGAVLAAAMELALSVLSVVFPDKGTARQMWIQVFDTAQPIQRDSSQA